MVKIEDSISNDWISVRSLSADMVSSNNEYSYRRKQYDPLLLVSLVHHNFSESASCVLKFGIHDQTTTTNLEDTL